MTTFYSDIRRHLRVYASGAVTGGSTGHITFLDASIRAHGVIMSNQVLANYASTDGDSGAPIFVKTGRDSAKIIGQHVGKICEVILDGRDITFCHHERHRAVTVFSPWPEVKNALGI